jgi:ELWxxDGT repeat protein
MRNGSTPTAEVNGRLYFAGWDAQTGVEPWVADPVTATAWRIGDLEPGVGSSDPARFAAFGGDVVFTAVTIAAGHELYRFQPNASAPVLVADVYPGPNSGVASWPLVASGSTLYFVGYQAATGEELWRTDGTTSGTAIVADISPGSGWGSPGFLVAPVCDGGAVLFGGADPTHGREMWITDGTTTGTRVLFDLIAGAGSGVTAYGGSWATLLGTTWVFLGTTAATGDELFVFDASLTRAPCATCPVAGCAGTNGIPSLTTRGQPALGNSSFAAMLQSARAASTAVFLLDGDGASTPLPGGCALFTGAAPVMVIHPTDAGGAATQSLPVPNQPWLLGVVLRTQWAVADPNGALLQTLSMSNGCYLVLGN